MMYQLGYRNFYGFHGMIDHALNGRWAQAADEALDSKWAKNDSLGLDAIIFSLLYKKHPNELKLVLIDLGKVEFTTLESQSFEIGTKEDVNSLIPFFY